MHHELWHLHSLSCICLFACSTPFLHGNGPFKNSLSATIYIKISILQSISWRVKIYKLRCPLLGFSTYTHLSKQNYPISQCTKLHQSSFIFLRCYIYISSITNAPGQTPHFWCLQSLPKLGICEYIDPCWVSTDTAMPGVPWLCCCLITGSITRWQKRRNDSGDRKREWSRKYQKITLPTSYANLAD